VKKVQGGKEREKNKLAVRRRIGSLLCILKLGGKELLSIFLNGGKERE